MNVWFAYTNARKVVATHIDMTLNAWVTPVLTKYHASHVDPSMVVTMYTPDTKHVWQQGIGSIAI